MVRRVLAEKKRNKRKTAFSSVVVGGGGRFGFDVVEGLAPDGVETLLVAVRRLEEQILLEDALHLFGRQLQRRAPFQHLPATEKETNKTKKKQKNVDENVVVVVVESAKRNNSDDLKKNKTRQRGKERRKRANE